MTITPWALLCLTASAENLNSPSIGGELLNLKSRPGLDGIGQNGVSAQHEGETLRVLFRKGNAYPNISFPIPQGGWNLTAFGGVHVEVR